MLKGTEGLKRTIAGLSLVVACAVPGLAYAASSDWATTDGVRMRMLSAGQPDSAGTIRAALQIDLKPGWKTYWRDPGSSGVPPSIDLSPTPGAELIEVRYPAPERFDDESGAWVGYKQSVVFPLTIRLQPDRPVEAQVFIGICETVCVPFQATLSLDPASDAANPDDAATIEAALEATPKPAGSAFQAVGEPGTDGQRIAVSTTVEGSPETAELFLASEDGYTFGVPQRVIADGKARFSVSLIDRPASAPNGKGIFYTLSSDAGAVEGYLPYF